MGGLINMSKLTSHQLNQTPVNIYNKLLLSSIYMHLLRCVAQVMLLFEQKMWKYCFQAIPKYYLLEAANTYHNLHDILCICFLNVFALQMVKLLISKGASINAQDKKDRRPLHWAAYMGNYPLSELALKCSCVLFT